jgi:hypothetical protein
MKNKIYHRENPFLYDMASSLPEKQYRVGNKVVIRDSDNPDKFVTDENGDILVVKGRGPVIKGPVDTKSYFKVFSDAVPMLMNLTRSGWEMFLYVALHLPPKKDKIYINAENARVYLNYKSTVSVHNGLSDLQSHKIISKAYSGKRGHLCFWINPDVIFNGNRMLLTKRIDGVIKTEEEYQAALAEYSSLSELDDTRITTQQLLRRIDIWNQMVYWQEKQKKP